MSQHLPLLNELSASDAAREDEFLCADPDDVEAIDWMQMNHVWLSLDDATRLRLVRDAMSTLECMFARDGCGTEWHQVVDDFTDFLVMEIWKHAASMPIAMPGLPQMPQDVPERLTRVTFDHSTAGIPSRLVGFDTSEMKNRTKLQRFDSPLEIAAGSDSCPRSVSEIDAAIAVTEDHVWHQRHLHQQWHIQAGYESVDPEVWQAALTYAANVRERLPWMQMDFELDEFAWGLLNGKLSALRWVRGQQWDNCSV